MVFVVGKATFPADPTNRFAIIKPIIPPSAPRVYLPVCKDSARFGPRSASSAVVASNILEPNQQKRDVLSAVSSTDVRLVCFLGQNDGIIEYSSVAGLVYGYPHSKVDDSRASPLLCTNFKHIVLHQFWRPKDDPWRLLRALISSIVCVNAILLSLELTSYYSSAGTRSLSAAALIAES